MSESPESQLHQRACHLMAEALDRPAGERAAFLDRECGGDAELRASVERLLAHHGRGAPLAPLLDAAAIASAPPGPAVAVPVPERIGPFRIVREIGRGGHGVVYEAEQEAPRRRIALKVLPPGWLAAAQAGRLEREAAALARFRHPGLAAIHAAGRHETDGGSLPWFAMELVEGERFDRHVARAGLDRRARVQLLRQVCDAVQHAHEQGVVHRDLKPANVLVRRDGQVKVVDFGVAALLDPGQQTRERMTASGAFVGTLAYVAPEQVADGGAPVDARSDVYSLGVMAYELLTGRLPLDPGDRPLPVALRLLAEFDPVAPARIDPALAGDLDTIVRKAIEKEPARRYASAAALRDDLGRWLEQRPILARPPSAFDRATKFARRNRIVVAAGLISVAALATGVTMLATGLGRARTALQESERQRVGSLELVSSLIQTVRKLADLPGGGTLLDQALADIRATIDRVQLGLHPDEDDLHALAAWATFLDAEGDLLLRDGQVDAAGARWNEALPLRARLAASPAPDDATAIERQRAHAVALVKLGDLAKARNDWVGAAPWYEQAHAILERLLAADPDHAGALDDLGYSLERRSEQAARVGRPAKAAELAQRRIELLERLVAGESATDDSRFQLARACEFRISIFEAPLMPADAARYHALALAQLDAIRDPGPIERRVELLRANLVRVEARNLADSGDRQRAVEMAEESYARLAQLVARHPGDCEVWASCQVAKRLPAWVASLEGRHEQAIAAYAELIASMRERSASARGPERDFVVEWIAHLLSDQLLCIERAGGEAAAEQALRANLAEIDEFIRQADDSASLQRHAILLCLQRLRGAPDRGAEISDRVRRFAADFGTGPLHWLIGHAEGAVEHGDEALARCVIGGLRGAGGAYPEAAEARIAAVERWLAERPAPPAASAAPEVDFARDIEPLFAQRCVKCHGPARQKGGLRLDRKVAALRGGDDGAVIVPGDSANSALIARVSGVDPEKQMPPTGEPLDAESVALLRAWIDAGAPWPEETASGVTTAIESDLWSLQPVRKAALPTVVRAEWLRNPVDAFVLAKLEAAGLAPAPEADRETLIRRLHFDLLGLPPDPAEIDAFVADPDPLAFEKRVDALLASPHYGERWGRHWLDVARFTESQGFEYDRLRDHAWPYRDWVIAAFNDDLPYDRFMQLQIAGDVIEPVTAEGIVATSLLVCGPFDEAGNAQANATQRQRTREEELEDLVSVVAQSFLGLTVNCARCHAHKFDPIPQEDYYRFRSIFDGVRHGERPGVAPREEQAIAEQVAAERNAIAALEAEIAALEATAREAIVAERRAAKPSIAPRGAEGPVPFARWEFEGDAQDALGSLHGTLVDGARIAGGRLLVDGRGAFLQTAPLPRDLVEKTLEVWLALPNVEQGGGGAISVESGDGATFDALVFAEREARRWMAGSNGFRRTREFGGVEEQPATLVHLALVQAADQTIRCYRNGELYGQAYASPEPLPTYHAGDAHVLFGKRHAGGANVFLAAEIERAALYDRALDAAEVAASFAACGDVPTRAQVAAAMTPSQSSCHAECTARLEQATRRLAALAVAPPMVDAGRREQPAPAHRLLRGDVTQPAEVVAPGGLSAIAEPAADFALAPDAPEAQRRLALAKWLADPRHPLPARVMVNRLWHHHFGRGIVGTPSDFGVSGERPSHPELLDWLAATFVEGGFSVKAMHRLLLNSATWRQSADANEAAARIDVENRLLWRHEPRRLEAEAVRDAMLAASGQLNRALGGPSFRPFDTSSFGSTFYAPVDKLGREFDRRTVYRMNVNSGKDPLLDVFDCPDPSVKIPARRATTTPLQALSMMNGSFVERQAAALATRAMLDLEGDTTAAIERAYRLALGRRATPAELDRAAAVARDHGLVSVCWALFNCSEFLHVR